MPRPTQRPSQRPDQDVASETQERRPNAFAGRPFLLGTIHPATEEIRELAATLGMRLVVEIYQPRERPHPGTFFGKGKLASLKDWVSELKAGVRPEDWQWVDDHWQPESEATSSERTAWGGTAWTHAPPGHTPPPSSAHGTPSGQEERRAAAATPDDAADEAHPASVRDLGKLVDADLLLVLNDDVRPAVLFNLEERLGIEVWDRTRLILEIFTQHAHVKEARLQVELAKLQYEVPLIHEAVHRQRAGERPGFMSGGEYGVADYEDFIKRRMRAVKDELQRIREEREVRRKVRRARFYLVSLAGYTNAGKSSLLNAMTGAGKVSEWTMFSTLETTTRRLKGSTSREPPEGAQNRYDRPILLTDTVGFIQALPSWLLEAFHSTLEEIGVSDVVLLVADVSDPVDVLLEKVRVCREELSYLDVTCPVLLVLNKADLVPQRVRTVKRARLVQAALARDDLIVEASSLDGMGMETLMAAIHGVLPDLIAYEARLPSSSEGHRLLSHLYAWGEVESVDYGALVVVKGKCDPIYWKEFQSEGLRAEADVSRRSH